MSYKVTPKSGDCCFDVPLSGGAVNTYCLRSDIERPPCPHQSGIASRRNDQVTDVEIERPIAKLELDKEVLAGTTDITQETGQ